MGSPHAEKKLDQVLNDTREVYKGFGDYGDLMVYPRYQKLLSHLLKTNLQRAETLSKSILTSSEAAAIPNHYLNKFMFVQSVSVSCVLILPSRQHTCWMTT